MNSSIKIFDENNNLSDDFNETVEMVLMGIHGDKYYDNDDELQDTRLLKKIKVEEEKEIPKKNTKKEKVTFKDFLPVLFFILITVVLCYGGYYFLNSFDISSLFGE